MPPVIKLPQQIINQIAAGQVIENPAAAVKELIENSVDAQATKITVQLEQNGLKSLRILDNGKGMSKKDLRLCYLHNTTSKVQSIDDLEKIASFGFRGEALASLAAISDLTIQSKEEEAVVGYKIFLKKGEIEEFSSIGMPEGTGIIIEDLFSYVPSRKNFLKSKSAELKKITETVTSIALAFPQISFKIENEGKVLLDLPSTKDYLLRVHQIFGQTMFEGLLPLVNQESYPQLNSPYLHLHGFISKPQLSYGLSKQYIYVNNRRVDNSAISFAVKEAYGSLLEPRQYPVLIIFLTIPYEVVNINLDAKKEKVAFNNNKNVIEIVSKVVQLTLKKFNLTYRGYEKFKDNSYGTVNEKTTQSYTGKMLKKQDLPWNIKNIAKTNEKNDILQLHNTFLFTETENGVLIVDQHAAHERILYEEFLEIFNKKKNEKNSYSLKKKLILDLSIQDNQLIENNLSIFENLGFEIEKFGNNCWRILSVPVLFKDRDIKKILIEMIEDLSVSDKIKDIDSYSEEMLNYLACRGAIKAGDKLTQEEMQRLLEKLKNTQLGYTCPHGRPAQIELTLKDLYKIFKRTK